MPTTENLIDDVTNGRSRTFETQSSEETIAAGREIATLLRPPKFLVLRGDLGAGKTTLVKGIAEGLHAAEADEVTSPTFTLIHEYDGAYESEGKKFPVKLYHLDLYRLEGERQLEALGLEELARPESIVLVEWGEKFPSVMKRSNGQIVMRSAGGNARKITVTFSGGSGEA